MASDILGLHLPLASPGLILTSAVGQCSSPVPREVLDAQGWGCPRPLSVCPAPGWAGGTGPQSRGSPSPSAPQHWEVIVPDSPALLQDQHFECRYQYTSA